MKASEVLITLGIKRDTLCKYVKDGKIKVASVLPNGWYDYDKASVLAYAGIEEKDFDKVYARLYKNRKKKMGRPKRRGPKWKKKKKKKVVEKPVVDRRWKKSYKIVSCKNGKQDGYIGNYKTLEEAHEAFNGLIEISNNVIFPKSVTNDGRLREFVYEYLVLERSIDGEKNDSMLRNEYGKLVQQESNSARWSIIDKVRYNVEETFWVYGYNPRSERKTFQWFYENKVLSGFENGYDRKRICLLYNKVIVKDDYGNIEFVPCKTTSDAIKFYNILEERLKKDRRFIFIGSLRKNSQPFKDMVSEIVELTGWDRYKVTMKTNKKGKF